MATFVTSPDSRFKAGTVLNAWQAYGLTPYGPVITTTTVQTDGTATFTGLESGLQYLAGVTISGPFVSFQPPAATVTDVSGFASFDLIQDVVTGWPDRPAGGQAGTWIGWTDPTDLMEEYDRFIPIPEPS